MTFKVSLDSVIAFQVEWRKGQKFQRFGQAWWNKFSPGGKSDGFLHFEPDEYRALAHIMKEYVNFGDTGTEKE